MSDISETVIDQSEDFVRFTIDGKSIDVDLYAARDALAKIDIKHAGDSWECSDCLAVFTRASDDTSSECPACHQSNTHRDEKWLDSVAQYVRCQGFTRCSRNTAGKFYNAVVERIGEIKKKSNQTPASPSGSEVSIQADGGAAESTPS